MLIKFVQFEAVASVVSRKDMFVVLPTGHGKSLIYAILPMVFDYLQGKTTKKAILYSVCYTLQCRLSGQYSGCGHAFGSAHDGSQAEIFE